MPGSGAGRRRHRSGDTAHPDLLARRAGATDHLAAGGDRRRARHQSRYLPAAGHRPEHHPDALARPSRRGRGPCRTTDRAPARRGGDRCRSGHHHRSRRPGARSHFRIPVRRAAARQERRAGRLQDRAPAGPGGGRDRARRSRVADRDRRRGALRRSHRLLQFSGKISRLHHQRHHQAARSDLSVDLHRPPARRAVCPGRSIERRFRAAPDPAIPRDHRFLAAAGGMFLPHGRGRDEEGLSRPCAPHHDDGVVVFAPVHVHQVRHLRRRRHRRPLVERRDVGGVHQRGPGARRDDNRQHPHRLSRFRLSRCRAGLEDGHRRHQQARARNIPRVGPQDPHGRCHGKTRRRHVG